MQTVIETSVGWMIRCPAHKDGWHEFPKNKLINGACWQFNGDLVNPTFIPSMNQIINSKGAFDRDSSLPESRCHFTITNGLIHFGDDCTHDFKGKTLRLESWPQEKIDYYKSLQMIEKTIG